MKRPAKHSVAYLLARPLGLALLVVLAGSGTVFAQDGGAFFPSRTLVVSRGVYDNNPNNVVPPKLLGTFRFVHHPPHSGKSVRARTPSSGTTTTSTAVSASLQKYSSTSSLPGGFLIGSLEVPNSSQRGVPPTKDQMMTSFSSKSELALNLSTDHRYLTFMGYLAPIDAIDVSNANTPGVVDPTNPVGENVFRVVAQVDAKGKFRFTKTNAHSGNNGRAAILNNEHGENVIYTAGNAGNGSNPQPDGIIIGAGLQILSPEVRALVAQNPGDPTPVGSFSITQLGGKADKVGKDTNFRGLTIFDNVLYATKGSGGNGVNTVYFVDTTGKACPSGGVGLPEPSASLPSAGINFDPALPQSKGVTSYNMCILKGFNTVLAKTTTNVFPFGV